MRNTPHISVLLEETISHLITDPKGVYIDGTLGYGGHSEAILEKLESIGMLIGLDLNPHAISYSENRLSKISSNYALFISNFKSFTKILFENKIREIQGFLLDLGLSSVLIDKPEYGFSYRYNGPLDMRFDRAGNFSAYDYINNVNEFDLMFIIKTTFDLRDAIRNVVPERVHIKVLSRVFQAIRIKINDEINVLKRTMELVVEYLSPGGRLAIISYNSLEDRIVISFINIKSISCICPPEIPICSCRISPKLKKITTNAIKPKDDDIILNSRSRSARLRIAERI